MVKKAELVRLLTKREKVSFCAGRSFWSLGGAERLGLPVLAVADGPHGLRKQKRDEGYQSPLGSIPAVCYPTASAFACSFDEDLIFRMGQALGEECREENVAVLLGPGVNIKRSPLCGRNFEYLSEDPLLAGKLAAALIKGVQSKGVGTSLKHFAANSQETKRAKSDSRIDARTLWEIYLKPFEIAVREGRPWTVMPAYNLLNGTYCCENSWLLQDVLRRQWGFEGTVISDWGAMNRCASSFRSGLDVEMPGGVNHDEEYLMAAVEDGRLPEKRLDEIAGHIIDLTLKHQEGQKIPYTSDRKAHLALAREVAENSAVLLKNEGVLPVKSSEEIAVIGALAKFPRYQGAGSSKVNAVQRDNPLAALKEAGCKVTYACGYSLKAGADEEQLLEEARRACEGRDTVLIFAGLPEDYESEGFDRENLELPANQNRLIREICGIHDKVAVILQGGGPVEMPWISQAGAVLMCYLGGCQGGHAAAAILTGTVNPSGKLAETFPVKLSDTPCFGRYPGLEEKVCYQEGIYVGYRYYDSADREVLFPFGHGLSYTSFIYEDIHQEDGAISFALKNSGSRPGKEAVQLYLSSRKNPYYKELIGFQKVELQAGEKRQVVFRLADRDFARFHEPDCAWVTTPGEYQLLVGRSSRDIRLEAIVEITERQSWPLDIPAVAVETPEAAGGEKKPRFTMNSTLREFQSIPLLRPVLALVRRIAAKTSGEFVSGERMADMIMDMPIRQLPMGTNGKINAGQVKGIIELLNGKPGSGLKKMVLGAGKKKTGRKKDISQ